MEKTFLWLLRAFPGWWGQLLAYSKTGTSVRELGVTVQDEMHRGPAPTYIEDTFSCFLTANEQNRSFYYYYLFIFLSSHTVWPFSLLEPTIVRALSIPTTEKGESLLSKWRTSGLKE